MSSARRMPDGTLCWSGSTCRRHGVAAVRAATAEKLKLTAIAPFNQEAKRKLNDLTNPFLEELQVEINQKYFKLFEKLQHEIPAQVEDEQLPNMKSVRRGLNNADDMGKKILDFEGLATRSELTEEDRQSS